MSVFPPSQAVVVCADPAHARTLGAWLGDLGLVTVTFPSVDAARGALDRGNPPSLIVLDLDAGGAEGVSLRHVMGGTDERPHRPVPILAVSWNPGAAGPDVHRSGSGVDALIPAPVDGHRFRSEARMLLRGRDGRRPAERGGAHESSNASASGAGHDISPRRIPLAAAAGAACAPGVEETGDSREAGGTAAAVTLRQLAQVVAASSDYIVLIGADYRYRFANDAYLRVRRLRREDLVGHHMSKVVGWERFEALGRPQVDAALRGEQLEAFEWADFGSGAKSYLHVRVAPFHEADGTITGVVMSGRDITDIKRVEEEKERLQSQLVQAQKMESVGRLAGGVAHDFNNMLQAILGNTALALEALPHGGPVRDCLQEIEKCAQRSADLTRQLLAFARKQTIAPQVLDLNATLSGMLKMLRRLIGEHIDLEWLPAAELGWVHMDPSQVDQILANLCVNARDAIGGGVGRVTIRTANVRFDERSAAACSEAHAGSYVLLSVSDTGCGMNPEVQAHLFEPFFSTKGVGQGTGLGLATVYGIVKQNGGFIRVRSEPERGTTFEIHLPRHVPRADRAGPRSSVAVASGGRETLLLVEDEPSILRVSQQVLERLGYQVLAARTPGEAMRQAREHSGPIHLLVTDVVMPEMNGRDLAANLLWEFPHLKRLFMSGYTADLIAHHGVLEPGVHFLQKPFSIEDLDAKVREALQG